jgi:hypothetical protein
MYNTKAICTYNTQEVFLDSDIVTNEEKDFIRDTLYKAELLAILGIEEFDETKTNIVMHNLYKKLENCQELKECMIYLANRFMSEDLELGLMLLFTYDYMYLSHICICEYLETGKITENNISKLKSIIFHL